jgi:hypothetical protein
VDVSPPAFPPSESDARKAKENTRRIERFSFVARQILETVQSGSYLHSRFHDFSELVTTSNACALTVLHTSQFIVGHAGSPQSVSTSWKD